MASRTRLLQLPHYCQLLGSGAEGTTIIPTWKMRKEELGLRNLPRVTLSDKPGLEIRPLDSKICTLSQYAYIASRGIKDRLFISGVLKGFFFSFLF